MALRCMNPSRLPSVFVCVLVMAVGIPAVQASERFLPANDQVVLTGSIHTADPVFQAFKQAERAWRQDPKQSEAAIRYARQAFLLGLSEGDLRWYGAAKAALMPWWQASDWTADGLFMRGLVKQGFHDFQGGLADIQAAIALDKTRSEFRSWQFVLHLLLADVDAAKQDCQELSRYAGALEGQACQAILDYRTGRAEAAIASLTQLVKARDFQGDWAQEWLRFHLGEAQRTAGQYAQAKATWVDHLSRRPRSHGIRLALVELLNAMGEHEQAKRWASVASPTDALLVQQLLASRALNSPDVVGLTRQLEDRMAAQRLRAEGLIERPTLIYLIRLGKDLTAGLDLAARNWSEQKEPPDALLLVEAALQLQTPQAAQPVLDWMARTGYTDPVLAKAVAQIKDRLRP